jgi:hypothetical protein
MVAVVVAVVGVMTAIGCWFMSDEFSQQAKVIESAHYREWGYRGYVSQPYPPEVAEYESLAKLCKLGSVVAGAAGLGAVAALFIGALSRRD